MRAYLLVVGHKEDVHDAATKAVKSRKDGKAGDL
jgi:hypothetical protein